jgi:hypothetical protein
VKRWLLRAAGVSSVPARGPARERVLLALVEAAACYLRAGGVVTPDAWLALSVVERIALETAGERVAATRAALYGLATQGPLGAASAYGVADGGVARRRVLLEQAVERSSASPVIGG